MFCKSSIALTNSEEVGFANTKELRLKEDHVISNSYYLQGLKNLRHVHK